MQTFLPYPDFTQSAQCLDRARLGKQRVECLQILKALTLPNYGWQNHPIVKAWRGYERALCSYGDAICAEWRKRGYRDTVKEKICAIDTELDGAETADPPWLGSPAFHSSHRAALLAKDPQWYSQFGWQEEAKIDYVWPS